MFTLTRNRLLSILNTNLLSLDDFLVQLEQDYEKKLISKEKYLAQLAYALKKDSIIKASAMRIMVKKGEVSNLIIADAAERLAVTIRQKLRETDLSFTPKVNLVLKTELKNFAEQFKKCLKERDAEIIINN